MASSKLRLFLAALTGVVLTLTVQKFWISDARDPYSFFELGSEIGKSPDEKAEIYRQQILAYFDENPHDKEAARFFSTMGYAGYKCSERPPQSGYDFMCTRNRYGLIDIDHFSVFILFDSNGKKLFDLTLDLGTTSL